MSEVLGAAMLVVGALFSLVAAVGVLRFPDLPMRMHAATKAGTLGAGLLLGAAAVLLPNGSAGVRALAAIAFLVLTAPVAAHVIARAALRAGEMPLWRGTRVNELPRGGTAGTARHVDGPGERAVP